MKTKQLQEVLKNHQMWLDSDGGERADLRGANLRGADLWGADLRGANLWGADLRGADLREADLREANLRGANLREANLREANLREANLWGANLWGADLREANLREAVGNIRELRSIFVETYPITYTWDRMNIGCENHSIEEWWAFDDETIDAMDGQALDFWTKFKPIIKHIIELCPAIKPDIIGDEIK